MQCLIWIKNASFLLDNSSCRDGQVWYWDVNGGVSVGLMLREGFISYMGCVWMIVLQRSYKEMEIRRNG